MVSITGFTKQAALSILMNDRADKNRFLFIRICLCNRDVTVEHALLQFYTLNFYSTTP